MKPDRLAGVATAAGAGMLAGVAAIFWWVPTDDFQGVVQRLFYVHAPAAWVAYLAFGVVVVGSVKFLRTSSQRWDDLARSSAEVGVVFTAITLVTGMMWGKPVWGTYWVWDPRLTLTFVLFMIYVGYLAFRRLALDEQRGARICAVLGITGFALIPLIHFSVDWWRGQHPGRVVATVGERPDLPTEMLITMLFMLAVFTLIYTVLLTLRMHVCRLEHRVLQQRALHGVGS